MLVFRLRNRTLALSVLLVLAAPPLSFSGDEGPVVRMEREIDDFFRDLEAWFGLGPKGKASPDKDGDPSSAGKRPRPEFPSRGDHRSGAASEDKDPERGDSEDRIMVRGDSAEAADPASGTLRRPSAAASGGMPGLPSFEAVPEDQARGNGGPDPAASTAAGTAGKENDPAAAAAADPPARAGAGGVGRPPGAPPRPGPEPKPPPKKIGPTPAQARELARLAAELGGTEATLRQGARALQRDAALLQRDAAMLRRTGVLLRKRLPPLVQRIDQLVQEGALTPAQVEPLLAAVQALKNESARVQQEAAGLQAEFQRINNERSLLLGEAGALRRELRSIAGLPTDRIDGAIAGARERLATFERGATGFLGDARRLQGETAALQRTVARQQAAARALIAQAQNLISRARNSTCPPCPPNPSPRCDRVPPSRPHFPCPGDHLHTFTFFGPGPFPGCKCDLHDDVTCGCP